MLKLGYLGPAGTHSHLAAAEWSSQAHELVPFKSIPALLEAFGSHQVARVIVPLENSLEGEVIPTIDWLMKHAGTNSAQITAELFLPVIQALMAKPGATLEQIHRAVSHPQALGQCRRSITDNHWEEEAAASTALAAKQVAEGSDLTVAAIGSSKAAEVYGLQVLEPDIGDEPNNWTRFVVLGGPAPKPSGDDKTTIFFVTNNVPGALHLALAPFSVLGINLTKIASRPIKTESWKYVFWVDADGDQNDAALNVAINRLRDAFAWQVIVAGSYPKGKQPVVQTKEA